MIINSCKEEIFNRAKEIIEAKGMELVEFRIFNLKGIYTVRCLVDYPLGGITIDECANINESLFKFIEEKGFFGENFTVEVNSPGLDRVLKNYKDFIKVKGRKILVWLNQSIENKFFLEGIVSEVKETSFFLKTKNVVYEVNFDNIKTAKEKIEF